MSFKRWSITGSTSLRFFRFASIAVDTRLCCAAFAFVPSSASSSSVGFRPYSTDVFARWSQTIQCPKPCPVIHSLQTTLLQHSTLVISSCGNTPKQPGQWSLWSIAFKTLSLSSCETGTILIFSITGAEPDAHNPIRLPTF